MQRRLYPLHLAGGMQQRLSLARGLPIEPDLLLADEPFPRGPDDDSLFEIEKEMTLNFVEMERERSLVAGA